MNIVPVAIALVVSFMSAVTLLGVSAENYTYGTQFVVINLSYLLGTPIVCYGFLPVFYKLQATSAYEVSPAKFNFRHGKFSMAHVFEGALLLLVLRKAFRNKS